MTLAARWKRLMSRPYRILRAVGEWHEHHHAWIAPIELTAALLGTITLAQEVHEMHKPGEAVLEILQNKDTLELILFVIVSLSIAARVATTIRALDLGPSFRNFFRANPATGALHLDERIFGQLRAVRDAQGLSGAALTGSPQAVKHAIQGLAREASTLFSVRTYGEPDRFWERWEYHYLALWHDLIPQAIWRIPGRSAPDDLASGYFSVIVPVDKRNYESLRNGHLQTALASPVDLDQPPARFAQDDLRLLIYTTQFVAPTGESESWDRATLIYAPLDHMAALIRDHAPDLFGANPARGLRLICESSNRTLDAVLQAVGFQMLMSAHHEDEEEGGKPRPTHSPAGFRLFELVLHPADLAAAGRGEENAAHRLFALVRYLASPPPSTPAGDARPETSPPAVTIVEAPAAGTP